MECKQFKGLLRWENLTQFLYQPTRITQDSQTLVDIIATSAPHNIKEFGVLSLSLSDHEFVYCTRILNWMKAASEVKVSGIMQSMTTPSFVMTLEMMIGMQMSTPITRTSTMCAV